MNDTRAQAFTLEGLVSSLVLLGALLFAIQSVVVVPTGSGDVDEISRANLGQQADDVLLTAAETDDNELSTLVRNWSQSQQTFDGAVNSRIGYGADGPPGTLGVLLNRTFTQRSYLYNVYVSYRPSNVSEQSGRLPVVYQGEPTADAVTGSHRVTLYDNQTLTAQNVSQNVELWEYDTNASNSADGYYPIPDAMSGPVYNVVEVRLVVW